MSFIYVKVYKFENYVGNVSVRQGIRSQSLLLCYQQIIVRLPTAVSFKVVKCTDNQQSWWFLIWFCTVPQYKVERHGNT